jgi:hypothetical protein
MKLTKVRLHKIINNNKGKQSRKKFKKNVSLLKHTNTVRNNKQFNLHNRTIKQI